MAKGATAARVKSEPSYPTDAEMRKAGFETLSSRIRHLASLGVKTSEIAKLVVRENGERPKYQHVRNVLKQPLKRAAEGQWNATNAG
jgi:hypothetical protein